MRMMLCLLCLACVSADWEWCLAWPARTQPVSLSLALLQIISCLRQSNVSLLTIFKTIPHGRSQVFAMLDTTLRLLYPLSEGGGGWWMVPVYLPALMQSSVARRQPDPIMSDVWWLMSVSTQTNPQIRSSLFLSYHVRTFKVNIIMKISTDRAWQSYKAITILFIQGYLGCYSLGQHQGHLRSSARPGKVRQTISQTMSSYRHYCSQHLEISIIFIVSNLIWQLLEPSFKGNRTTMI